MRAWPVAGHFRHEPVTRGEDDARKSATRSSTLNTLSSTREADAPLLPSISYVQPGDRSPRARIIDAIERLSGRKTVEGIYHQLKGEPFDPRNFFARALQLAGIRYHMTGTDERRLPREGPLILIANHPFGVVDGLILCDIATRLRGDFRILIHALLCRDADLDPFFLPIDFRDTKQAAATNIRSKRDAMATLADGGVLLVFPGGGISTRRRRGLGPLAELPWSTFTAKLITRSNATVVPLFFHGCNSRLFHLASGISDALRAALLLHEARNKLGRDFRVRVGEPVTAGELSHLDRPAMTRHLHDLTWGLGAAD